MTMRINFVDPRGKTFEYWSNLIAEQLASVGVTLGGNEKTWRNWARRLVSVQQLVTQGLPSPDDKRYKHWHDWAIELLNYSVDI